MIIKLLIIHFISDFLLQRRWVAKNKSSDGMAMAEHISIIFCCFLYWGPVFAGLNALIHMIIDKNIWNAYKWFRRKEDKETFKYWEDHLFYSTIGFDQLLHVLTLVVLAKENF
jgi:hypothetical protein